MVFNKIDPSLNRRQSKHGKSLFARKLTQIQTIHHGKSTFHAVSSRLHDIFEQRKRFVQFNFSFDVK